MPLKTLAEILTEAFTATESPPQTAGYDFGEKEHEVLGDVPLPVQWLHEIGAKLTREANVLVHECQSDGGCSHDEAIHQELGVYRDRLDTINSLKWRLLEDSFSFDGKRHSGIAILQDWKVAAKLKQVDDGADEENAGMPDFLEQLLRGSGMVVGVVEISARRPRRHDA